MHIFLTGTSSFIGRELLRLCDERRIQVTGIDAVNSGRPGCSVGDIRSPSLADSIPEGVDAVVHLAALSRDPDCRNRAQACFDINVMGTLNVMEAALARKAGQFIFASTEWVYDSFRPGIAKTEDDPINPALLTSEYALSKLVSENNLRQKHQHGFMDTTILRFGIVYGPRKANWSAAEALLSSVATKDEVSVGSLETGRGFIHVTDICRGILAAVGLRGFEIVNLQGPKMATLGDVIAAAMRITGRSPAVVESNPAAPSIRLVSGAKAERLMNFRPAMDIETGLANVAQYLGFARA